MPQPNAAFVPGIEASAAATLVESKWGLAGPPPGAWRPAGVPAGTTSIDAALKPAVSVSVYLVNAVSSPVAKVTLTAPNSTAAPTSAARAGLANGWASPSDIGRGSGSRLARRCAPWPRLALGARPTTRVCTAGIRPARSAGMSAVTPTTTKVPIDTTRLTHTGRLVLAAPRFLLASFRTGTASRLPNSVPPTMPIVAGIRACAA